MPFKVSWYIPDHILYTRMWGQVSHDDLTEMNHLLNQHLDESSQQMVYQITDDSEVQGISPSLADMKQSITVLTHPRLRWVLVVGEVNLFINFMVSTLMHLFRVRYRRMKTLDEALKFVVEQNPALAELMLEKTLES